MKEGKFIWMNGRLVEWKEAKVHFLTHALHYGTGVFEGIRCYNTSKGPAVFRLDDHIKRLFDSAHIVDYKLPYSEKEIKKAIIDLIKANNFKECYIRPLAYLGYGKMGLNPIGCKVDLGIAAWPWGAYLGEEGIKNGVKVRISSFLRHHVDSMMNDAKAAGNYVNSCLAKEEAIKSGCDEAIMLDTNGFVSECTGENLFMIRERTMFTAPTATVLEGITRKSVMEIAKKELKLKTIEEFFTRDQLYIADELFMTGTAAEITPIRIVDDREIGKGKPGTITKKLQKLFIDIVKGKNRKYSKWLTLVK